MAEQHETAQLSLSDYAGLIRRRFKILGAFTIGAALLALAYLAVASPGYVATSRLELSPVSENPFSQDVSSSAKVYSATEKTVVKSNEVATLASLRMSPKIEPSEMVGATTVDILPDTLTLDISYTAASADRARAGADAMALSYIEYRQRQAEDIVAASVKRYDQQIAALDKLADPLRAQLSKATVDSGEFRQLELQLNSIQDTKAQMLLDRSNRLLIDTSPATLVSKAETPSSTAGLSPSMLLIGMLALGLTAGFAVAVVRDRTDPRLRGQDDLASVVGSAPINFIESDEDSAPREDKEWFGEWYGKAASRYAPGVMVAHNPSGAEAESYRRVALRLRSATGEPLRYVLVTSSGSAPAEEVASNLAVTLGRDGRRVLLIWSNLREDTMPTYFAVGRGPGLGEVLSGRVRLQEAIMEIPGCQGLYLLPVGSREDARDQIFRFAQVKETLDDPKVSPFDAIILIAPSPNRYADALALAPQVDGVLIAVDTTDSDRRDLTGAVESLQSINATISGVVAL